MITKEDATSSHWTTVKTKLTDQRFIEAALKRMGLKYQVGDFVIKQYEGSSQAQIKFDNAVGLARQQDGTWAMVGDFYHSKISELKQYYGRTSKFSSDLTTQYAIVEAKITLEDQGFSCTENKEAQADQDGIITMCYESWC